MTGTQIALGVFLVLLLLAVASFFGLRQRKTMHLLRNESDHLADEDRHYLRRQVRRRVLCSVLMVVLALFLVGWFFLQPMLGEIKPAGPEDKAGDHPEVRVLTYYWIAFLLVLFGILALAAFDLVATARFGFRHHKMLEIQRRAMLQAEAARLRAEHRDEAE